MKETTTAKQRRVACKYRGMASKHRCVVPKQRSVAAKQRCMVGVNDNINGVLNFFKSLFVIPRPPLLSILFAQINKKMKYLQITRQLNSKTTLIMRQI